MSEQTEPWIMQNEIFFEWMECKENENWENVQ